MSGESSRKNGTRGGERASKKNKSFKTLTTTKSAPPHKSASRLAPSQKSTLRSPSQGRFRQAGAADSGTPKKREKEKSSALQERIEVNIADLKNRRRQIAWLVQEKARESYGFLLDELRSAKKNALVIFTTTEKWFYFCRPTNLAFQDLTIS